VSRQFAAGANRRLKFHKRSQLFISVHETLLVTAMHVNNPDCSASLAPLVTGTIGMDGCEIKRHG
jgi:hypothetical protein